MSGYWGGNAELHAMTAKVQEIADFDHPFIMDGSVIMGGLRDAPGYYAPSVTHDDEHDVLVDGMPLADSEWSAITGMTGQDRYNGAVMHASEFIGSAIAERMSELSEEIPQVFVIVACEVDPTDDDPEPEPAGWVILYREATGEQCKF